MCRCKARTKDKFDSGDNIWLSMQHWRGVVVEGMSESTNTEIRLMLDELLITTTTTKIINPRQVIWEKPLEESLKLNVHGSC